jgi:DNA-binding NarL/FixJ family response regulator
VTEHAAVPGPAPVRVVIADDHPVVRAGLSALLSSLPGIEVVGIACTGREAVREVVTTRPDVAVLDLQMPDLGGVEAAREIARVAPAVAVLVLTMSGDDESLVAAMRAGARGYLVKGAEQDEIARAIRAVAAGEAIFGPAVASRVLGLVTSPPTPAEPFPGLTPRELEVLDLLADGLSNTAIAQRLGVAGKTVANTVSSVFAKLQVADRGQAIVRAREAGLGTRGAPPP